VHHAVEHAASDLARSAKIPGFRKGKVPRRVLVQKLGRERVMAEAVDSHIGGWFWNAAAQSRVRPVEQPEYDFQLPDSEDEDWQFTATVTVQAKPDLADWTTLEVGAYEPEVPQDLVDRELDALRSTVAELVRWRVGRSAPTTPVVVDMISPQGEARRDYVVELGRGAVVDEIEHGLVGLNVGDSKEIEFELADGSKQNVSVTVKEIKEKVLPPLDDEAGARRKRVRHLRRAARRHRVTPARPNRRGGRSAVPLRYRRRTHRRLEGGSVRARSSRRARVSSCARSRGRSSRAASGSRPTWR